LLKRGKRNSPARDCCVAPAFKSFQQLTGANHNVGAVKVAARSNDAVAVVTIEKGGCGLWWHEGVNARSRRKRKQRVWIVSLSWLYLSPNHVTLHGRRRSRGAVFDDSASRANRTTGAVLVGCGGIFISRGRDVQVGWMRVVRSTRRTMRETSQKKRARFLGKKSARSTTHQGIARPACRSSRSRGR
jgi:hypothetical protein